MQELKDAEELVNEYRQHPPKIGWRTVFVQFSQYTRLDVGPRKPDTQVTTSTCAANMISIKCIKFAELNVF